MKEIKIGLIGASWMGNYHSVGMTNVRQAYGNAVEPIFGTVADINEAAANKTKERFGYEKATTDWKDVVADDTIDLVIVATPNYVHAEQVIALAEAGKNIVCEKPMAMTLEEGKAMVDAVEKNKVKSLVDFIYTKCPVNNYASKMIGAGEIGDIVTFRGWFDCDYCADPETPATWRQYKKYAGTGALGDLTAHIISLSDQLMGNKIAEVFAASEIVFGQRPEAANSKKMIKIDTDDQIYIIVKYENGRLGTMSSSRVAVGHPCELGYELQGTKGTIKYELPRINELQYFNKNNPKAQKGFTTIKGNVEHGDYKQFCLTDDLGIAYSDVMTIQAYDILTAIAENRDTKINIAYGHYVDRVMKAMETSAENGRWVKISEV
jgi:predicted dehydrogenase